MLTYIRRWLRLRRDRRELAVVDVFDKRGGQRNLAMYLELDR